MSNDVSSREAKAKHELDKAYERLLKNAGLTRLIIEELGKAKDVAKAYDILTALAAAPLEGGDALKKTIKELNAHYKIAGITIELLQDWLKGNDGRSAIIGLAINSGLDFGIEWTIGLLSKPLSGAYGLFTTGISIGNLINKATGSPELDINKWLKERIEELRGVTTDLPEIKNGMMYLTMRDGTIYARSLTENGMHFISGSDKPDVLFGGANKDILIGHGGGDLLIGGAGVDDYFVNNGDIIDDSDKKGRIFDSATQKQYTGGTFDKKSGYYIGENGWYKIEGNDLIINNKITVKGFNKDNNDLGITLLEADDIAISIRGKTVLSEQGNGKHSEGYKIELNRSLEKNEWMIVKVLNDNGEERYVFYGDVPKEYYDALFSKMVYSNTTYLSWDGNTTANEDINVAVGVSVYAHSDNIKVKSITPLEVTIKDDDRDPKDDLPETYDPIVIDFNKNGITSTRLDNTVYFDHDNNGFKEATAWIEKDDGLLALDKNGNGKIDNGNELFGNHTISNTIYGYTDKKATNGYEALKAYDLNNDNVIDEKDEIFSKLKIWKDANSNGITDEGELSSLTHNNIKSIDLNYKEIAMDENSNTVKQSSKVTLKDGSVLNANDVWFKVNLDKTKEEDINIPLEIRSLPQVKAFGNLNSLQIAASKSDTLAAMINLYLMLNPEDRKKHINDIVYEWAGVNDMDPNSRTISIDSRMVNVYEKITGKPFTWHGNFNDENIRISANIIKERFDVFKHYVYATIELQTTYADIDLDTETMSLENNVKPSYKFDALNSKLTQLYKDNRHDEIKNLMDIVREAGAYKPVFQETLKTNLISLCSSDNKFLSLCLNTYIQGTDDDNTINGSFENNFIVGGKGNDILYGGGGNDIYAFAKGDGKDTIYDTAGNDKIEFKEGIAPGDVSFKRELDKLIISIKSGSEADGDSITIQNFFSVNPAIGNNTVRTITFADGTVYDFNKILELTPLNSTDKDDKLYLTDDNDTFDAGPGNDEIWGGNGDDTLSGGKGDDILYGNNGNDTIYGNEGNDVLHGDLGNDTLIGGRGNDQLYGESGNDTYIFGRNWGNDTIIENYYDRNNIIKFTDNITKNDLVFNRNDRDLIISDKAGANSICVKDVFYLSYDYAQLNSKISKIVFADGSEILEKDFIDPLLINPTDNDDKLVGAFDANYTIDGKGGNDTIITNKGNDTLIGGKGNDTLMGGEGDDTYIYKKGDGNDIIRDLNGNNIIYFKDIGRDGIEFLKNNDDLIIKIKESNETITIKDVLHSYQRDYVNFAFKFMDESIMNIHDVQFSLTGDDENNVLRGYTTSDTIYGKKGNDTIYGGAGNDTYIYHKGDGNDIIYDLQGSNIVEFKDINRDEVTFTESRGSLLVTIRDTNEQITIMNFFNSESSSMSFGFADGTTLDKNAAKAAALIGDDKDNIIQGYYSDDILKGNDGNDTLYGGGGSDTLEGGKGNDILVGNTGVDTYVFGRGDGQDVIYALDADYGRFNIDANGNYNISYYYNQQNVKGTDIIKFKEGISKNDLIFERAGANGHDLLIKIKDTDDSITVKDMFSDAVSSKGIDKIEFADGSFMSTDDIYKNTPLMINRADQERTNGSVYSDTIIGNDQNNIVYANDGDDTLTGGKGNDYLDGGNGNDIYVYNKGDGSDTIYDVGGTDTIKFGQGISKQDIVVKRIERVNANGRKEYSDIKISFKNSPNDSITVKDVIASNKVTEGNKIETFEFENGEKLSFEDIKKLSLIGSNESDTLIGYVHSHNIMSGNEGNDKLYGQGWNDTMDGGEGDDIIESGSGNDTLIGGTGNDTLNGGIGDDVYIYNKGDGKDTIIDGGGTDVIKFGQGINKEDLIATKIGKGYYGDIVLTFANSQNDSITIKNIILAGEINNANKIEALEFANGEKLKIEDIKLNIIGTEENDNMRGYDGFSNIIKGNGGNDNIQGGELNDTVYGGEGDDTIDGGTGNDILMGGEGDDRIYGGEGNDTIDGGTGNDALYGGDGEDKLMGGEGNDNLWGESGNDTLIGGEGNDELWGESGDDVIDGGNGNDNIQGGSGNDTITGGDGDDIIKGEDGNDIIDGGTGNDALYGGGGEDTYLFGKGDGQDTVSADGNDIIKFKAGITRDDLILRRSEYQKDGFDDGLILTIKNSLDSITIKDVFKDESNSQGIKGIEFNDGSSMNLEDIKKGVLISSDSDQKTFYGFNSDDTIIGGDGNEYLYGKGGNDTLIGNKGDDIISGGDGNDILIGGEGNDELQGGSGNDTYVFGRGDGNDKIINYDSDSGQNDIIKFEEDITKDDLIFKRVRTSDGVGDLVVSIKGTKDSICVSGMFNVVDNNHILNEQYKINKIEFSDGSYMDLEAIQLALKNNNVIIHSSYFWRNNEGSDEDDEIYGDDDSNYLAGNKGDDILIGGKGADRLDGGEGADTYVFAKGDGNDTISADGNDIIKFKEGISKDDLLITREYSNLKINFKNSDDSITVSGMFYEADGNSQGIKAIEFSDGSSLSLEDIRKTVLANNDSVGIHDIIYGFNTDDVIMGSSQMNFIRARGGNDTVYGKEGNDTISGDAGNDLLIGGEGDDTYEYNMGDGNDTIDNTGGGNDTILFSYGISKDDVSFKKDGNDLIVTVNKDSSQTINVKNHFLGGDYAIDQIKFASNGSVLSRKDILKLMNTVHLTSEGGNNNLVDKGQKDNVYTYAGGRVTISDNGGYDKVIFKNKTYSVNYSKKGDNLLISANKITASNNNVLEVKDFFKGANHIIEDFDLSEYSLVTARRIYEDFGITYPVAQSKQEVLTGGKEDNVYIYTGGRKIIDDKGGNDRVVFQGLEEGLFYRQKGNNLLISTKKMTTDNEDVLEVKNFFSNNNSIIEEFQITDYWSVSARKIYEDFDETYPASTSTQNAPLALLGTTNKNNEASLNDNASDM